MTQLESILINGQHAKDAFLFSLVVKVCHQQHLSAHRTTAYWMFCTILYRGRSAEMPQTNKHAMVSQKPF